MEGSHTNKFEKNTNTIYNLFSSKKSKNSSNKNTHKEKLNKNRITSKISHYIISKDQTKEKHVQRNQSTIIKQSDNIKYSNQNKKMIPLLKNYGKIFNHDNKINNLSYNKVPGSSGNNKTMTNESKKRISNNKSVLGKTDSFNKLLITENNNYKKGYINKIPFDEKKILGKSALIPPSNTNNTFTCNINLTKINKNNKKHLDNSNINNKIKDIISPQKNKIIPREFNFHRYSNNVNKKNNNILKRENGKGLKQLIKENLNNSNNKTYYYNNYYKKDNISFNLINPLNKNITHGNDNYSNSSIIKKEFSTLINGGNNAKIKPEKKIISSKNDENNLKTKINSVIEKIQMNKILKIDEEKNKNNENNDIIDDNKNIDSNDNSYNNINYGYLKYKNLHKNQFLSDKNNNIFISCTAINNNLNNDKNLTIKNEELNMENDDKNSKTNDNQNNKKIHLININNYIKARKETSSINLDNLPENTPQLITESLIGLVNSGETCYMNTGLQNLIHCIPFISQLFSVLPFFKENIEQKKISYTFINLCLELISNNNKYCINSYDPSKFRRYFCHYHREYSDYGQHDSLEFLRNLLDDISKELNQTKIISQYKELKTEGKTKKEQNYEYNDFYLCRENSIVVKVFYSQIMNIFTCDCGFVSYSFEKLLDIPLLFPTLNNDNKEILLNDLITYYFNGEKISWTLPCEKCHKKDLIRSKIIKLTMLPEVIIFSLQRFNPITGVKVNKVIGFDEIIDLKCFCDCDFFNGEINTKYKLFGISNHSGSINFGHYYSYTKVKDNWYMFNDSCVKQINLSLVNKAAYFFFYEKF